MIRTYTVRRIRNKPDDCFGYTVREEACERPRGKRYRQSFSEEHTKYSNARCAKRLSNRGLALPCERPREHQIGDVCANDEQRKHRHDRENREKNRSPL